MIGGIASYNVYIEVLYGNITMTNDTYYLQ